MQGQTLFFPLKVHFEAWYSNKSLCWRQCSVRGGYVSLYTIFVFLLSLWRYTRASFLESTLPILPSFESFLLLSLDERICLLIISLTRVASVELSMYASCTSTYCDCVYWNNRKWINKTSTKSKKSKQQRLITFDEDFLNNMVSTSIAAFKMCRFALCIPVFAFKMFTP